MLIFLFLPHYLPKNKIKHVHSKYENTFSYSALGVGSGNEHL